MRGWYNMACWNGLSPDQQATLIEWGGLGLGYVPAGDCPNGADVEVTTMYDKSPGPRFYCMSCAVAYLTVIGDTLCPPDLPVPTERNHDD